jgi:thiosulfate dehydrogenase [quinone] large subunit
MIMKDNTHFSGWQLTSLVALRILIGWHLLYEGFTKLIQPSWSSVGFLKESKWILSGLAEWIISSPSILAIVNTLNTWGLIAIGLGLILGLFARAAAMFGALLLLLYYLNNPPLLGLEYAMPNEGSYLIVSKTLIEAAALFALFLFPTSAIVGLDFFRVKFSKSSVK